MKKDFSHYNQNGNPNNQNDNPIFDSESSMDNNTIEYLLTDDETLLWQGQPNKMVYIIEAVLKMLPIAIIWGVFDFGFIYLLLKFAGGIPWFIYLFFAFHLLPVWMWIAHIVHAVMEIKNIKYAITDKRIIVRSGIVVDLNFVYYKDINDVHVKVGLVERMFKVGDVNIRSNIKAFCLDDIPNPYKLGNYIQKVVRDIQTDTYFPNAYRPGENPGYKTSYKNAYNDNRSFGSVKRGRQNKRNKS